MPVDSQPMLVDWHSYAREQTRSVSNQNRFARKLEAYPREPFPMHVEFHVHSMAKYVHSHNQYVHKPGYHVHRLKLYVHSYASTGKATAYARDRPKPSRT